MIRENFLKTLKRHYYADAGVEHIVAALQLSGNFTSMFNRSADIDGEGTSYYAEYLPDARTIKARIYIGGFPVDRVEAKINESGFTTALMAGGAIPYYGTLANVQGLINGNVRSNSFSNDLQNSTHLTIIGTVNTSGTFTAANIPHLINDLTSAYGGLATRVENASFIFDTPNVEEKKSYFVKGNIEVLASNVSITGFLAATGTISIGVAGDHFTMNADRTNRYPALIADGNIYIGDSQALNVTINGLVYSGGDIYIRGAQNLKINGALVARGDIIFEASMNPINNMNINYDPDLRPFNFTGGDSGPNHIKIVSWKGSKN
jgi:hypothetical protein